MRTHEDLWGPVVTCGDLWGPLGTFQGPMLILRRTIRVISVEQGTLYPLWAVILNGGCISQHFCPS